MEQQVTPATEPSFREQVDAAENTPVETTPVETQQQEEASPADEQPSGDNAPQEQKTVPLGALHEERAKRRKAEAAIMEQNQRFDMLQQRLDYMAQLAQQQQPKAPEVPTFDADPIANIGHTMHQTQEEIRALKENLQRNEQQAEQVRVANNFYSAVGSAEKQFAETKPDYFQAVDWAMARKTEEYQAIGMMEHEARARVRNEAANLAYSALQRGESPAEVAYRMAGVIGYKPQAAGGDAAKLEMQRSGRAASSPSAGGGNRSTLSLDALAKMSSDDFLKATSGDNWKKLMGKA